MQYEILQKPGYSLGIFGQYSWTGTSHDSGTQKFAGPSEYTYTYFAHQNVRLDAGEGPGDTPFSLYKPEVIFDPVAASGPGTFQSIPAADVPKKSVTVTTVRSSSSLDVNLHEFVLGFEFTKNIGDRLHLFASVGPSFELVDWDLTSEARFAGKSYSSKASGQKFKLGVAAQGGISFDLDQAKRWSVEVHGGYNYADKVDVSTGNSSARIDVSSWLAGTGITWHF